MTKERANELILRIAKQDESALQALYDELYPLMIQIALNTLKEKSYAEDVVSEAFLKIYQKSHQFKKEYNGLDWIYSIVRYQAIDYDRWYIKKNEESYIEQLPVKASRKVKNIEKYEIRWALKTLNETEYDIIKLRIWERWTLKDIAEKYNYPLIKVYRLYQSALVKLKEVLG